MTGIKGQPTPGNPNIKNFGFGSRSKEVDDEYRSRIKGVPRRKRIWTDDNIADFIDEMLTLYKKILMDDEKINKEKGGMKLKSELIMDMNTMMNRLLQFKEKYYPTIQKNINVNLDLTTDAVIKRLKEWKKEQVVVIGENE